MPPYTAASEVHAVRMPERFTTSFKAIYDCHPEQFTTVILSAADRFACESVGGVEGPLHRFSLHNGSREFSHCFRVLVKYRLHYERPERRFSRLEVAEKLDLIKRALAG